MPAATGMSDPFVTPVLIDNDIDSEVLSLENHWANRIDENKSASSKNQGSLPYNNVAYGYGARFLWSCLQKTWQVSVDYVPYKLLC